MTEKLRLGGGNSDVKKSFKDYAEELRAFDPNILAIVENHDVVDLYVKYRLAEYRAMLGSPFGLQKKKLEADFRQALNNLSNNLAFSANQHGIDPLDENTSQQIYQALELERLSDKKYKKVNKILSHF
ncbi:MAG: hypothetical protein LBM73_00815 [Candidatus Nomurabacteria bacterium]|jgi:hypothetical protein|nr:hypothetical protein [Candidatus Nomurabacteria bacterium]